MMATEKDKVIAGLCGVCKLNVGDRLPDKTTHEWMALLDKAWEAARADAIEECAKIAEKEIGATRHEIAAALRSLSRKQEEPR